MTSYGLDECFWAMFELTPTWPNFACQLFMWIEANNDQIYDFLGARRVILSNVQADSKLDIISILVNFSYELGQIGGSFGTKVYKVGLQI